MRTLRAVLALAAAGASLYLRGYRRGRRSRPVLCYDLTYDDLHNGRPGRISVRQNGLEDAGVASHVRWEPIEAGPGAVE